MHKKNIFLITALILLVGILIILSYTILQNMQFKDICSREYIEFSQKNNEQIFTIDKITYFSNCSADISTNTNSSFTIKDLYQYTDIAIFINNNNQENNNEALTHKNTLKSVSLTDINFSLSPSIGTPNLYYKNINDFANPTYSNENIIENNITFDTTSEDEIDYSKPILYNNCANPITLTYVNTKIKDNYTLADDISNISHNGSLLKTCGITLNSISCQVSLVIKITNHLDEVFTCPITLNIPLSTENSTIYDGSLTLKDSTNYKFIKE